MATSARTQYRLYGWRFLQVWWPNQRYQSTEGESYKGKIFNIFNIKFSSTTPHAQLMPVTHTQETCTRNL